MRLSSRGFSSKAVVFLVFLVFALFLVLRLIAFPQNSSLNNNSIPLPTPTSTIRNPEVHSPDGTKKLVLQTKIQRDGSTTYSFVISDIDGKNPRILFTKTVESAASMVIPANSWSPDNKYVFLRENGVGFFDIVVIKASGDVFSDGKPYIDVTALFTERKIAYSLTDITGWDSPTLLHVKTAVDSTKRGPSYWFDVESFAFLQLAS